MPAKPGNKYIVIKPYKNKRKGKDGIKNEGKRKIPVGQKLIGLRFNNTATKVA
jgi:hypothetical protein